LKERIYIAFDLKSFYASVECRERGLDPMDTNLVVADESRTDKTICLAVTPPLKSCGISGRGRLFEVKQRVIEVNSERRYRAPQHKLSGSSYLFSEPIPPLRLILLLHRREWHATWNTVPGFIPFT